MSDKEKLEKVVKLADAMYHAAQYLTTDASRLHKAMEEYHQFIINDYCKKEPASEDLEQASIEHANKVHNDTAPGERIAACRYDFKAGAQWQKEREFTHIEPTDNGYQAAIHYMEDCQDVDDFTRRGIMWIAERYFIQGAKWREKQYLVSKDMEIAFKEYAKREHCECDLETSGEPIQYDSTNDLIDACRYGALLQKEQMMKDAIDATVTSIREYREENEVDFTIMLEKGIVPYVSEEDVKLIIIKE